MLSWGRGVGKGWCHSFFGHWVVIESHLKKKPVFLSSNKAPDVHFFSDPKQIFLFTGRWSWQWKWRSRFPHADFQERVCSSRRIHSQILVTVAVSLYKDIATIRISVYLNVNNIFCLRKRNKHLLYLQSSCGCVCVFILRLPCMQNHVTKT